jgi:N-acetylneuraminate synthase
VVGQGVKANKVFIIAEAGSNWKMGTPARDIKMGRALIEVAAEAEADAVKFQTYRSETVYVPNAGNSDYLSEAGISESITDIFADLSMPYEMIPQLADHCKSHGIEFMSTPFSVQDARAVDPYVKTHKIASYEISHSRLLEFAGKTAKPLFLSTGAATVEEIEWAINHFYQNGGKQVTLMQTTARYPAPLSTMNLKVISTLAKLFGTPIGLSDHSRDPIIAPVAAVALGAVAIEKHFTLDNRLPGPDHSFAITANELKTMVRAIRACEETLGDGEKIVQDEEKELRYYAQRAIQAIKPIGKGDLLKEGVNIDILRPGKQKQGLHPRHLVQIEGSKAKRDISIGEGISTGDYE